MKAVIFDVGRVLLSYDYALVASELERKATRPVADLELECNKQVHDDFHCGRLSDVDFWLFFCREFGYRGTYQEFDDAICSSFVLIPDGVQQLKRFLAAPDVKVGVLSDNHSICTRWMARNLPVLFDVDALVLSQDLGMMKPEAGVYREVLGRLALKAADCIFIDDKAPNIEQGRRQGMAVVHHTSWEVTRPIVEEFVE